MKKFKNLNIIDNYKLHAAVAFAVALFFFRLFVYRQESVIESAVSEMLLVLSGVLLVLYINDFVNIRKVNPLSLVMSLGILSAVLFFFMNFSEPVFTGIFGDIKSISQGHGLFSSLIIFFYSYLLVGAIAFIFLVFKEFYFLKQKKQVSVYFNTMLVFFFLTAATAPISTDQQLSYIHTTFFIVSLILIVINSIKISWIAFIVKKEKISLLVLSVIISALFIINLANTEKDSYHSQLIYAFSPFLSEFFQIMMIYGVVYFSILFFTTLFHIPTAEAFDRKAREVSSLQYFSKLITQVLDFSDLAETVTDIAMRVCNADCSWIIWNEDDTRKIIAVKNVAYIDADRLTSFLTESGILRGIQKTVVEHNGFTDSVPELSEKFSSIAISPLRSHNQVTGFLITARKNDFIFDDEDRDALDTFSDYASVAIENSSLLEQSIEKERLEKELDVAREVQRKILPNGDPVYDKLTISSVFIPAFEVGGDYYDFFELDDGMLGFIIADVSGKGISAAFIMAEVKGIFESLSKTIKSPGEILIKANQILRRTLDRRNFVSAFYGLIDFEKEKLIIARAGHCPLILVRNGEAVSFRPRGLGLGLNYEKYFAETLEETEIDLHENDTLVFFTDGITEAKNGQFEDFGDSRFQKILLENSSNSADDIANKVIHEITSFASDSSQHDDITLVIFKWKQKLNIDGEKEWQNLTPQLQTKEM